MEKVQRNNNDTDHVRDNESQKRIDRRRMLPLDGVREGRDPNRIAADTRGSEKRNHRRNREGQLKKASGAGKL